MFFQEFVVKMWSNQENRVRKQVKNPCEARKIKASQILHKKISTHLLTVLIMRVIVHTEQRKREKRNLPEKVLTEFADVFRNSKLKTPAQHAANIDQEE